jgi:hypothetical protein
MMLGKIFWSRRKKTAGDWRKLRDEERNNMHSLLVYYCNDQMKEDNIGERLWHVMGKGEPIQGFGG